MKIQYSLLALFLALGCASQDESSKLSYFKFQRKNHDLTLQSSYLLVDYRPEGSEAKCGATFITRSLAITAAHCLEDREPNFAKSNAAHNLRLMRPDQPEELEIEQVYSLAPSFDFNYASAPDLAVVRISTEVPPSHVAKIASYEYVDRELAKNRSWLLLGAGSGENSTSTFEHKPLHLVENDAVQVLGPFGPKRDVKTFQVEPRGQVMELLAGTAGNSACPGDSGSGLFTASGQLVAIASRSLSPQAFHRTCANSNQAIYTIAGFSQEWLRKTLPVSDFAQIQFL